MCNPGHPGESGFLNRAMENCNSTAGGTEEESQIQELQIMYLQGNVLLAQLEHVKPYVA